MTVRTIRYYDTIGLLKPSAYTASGRRTYTALDYARLQQILTLKLIGLSLEEIKSLLTSDLSEIAKLLERQKRILTQQVAQLSTVIQAIESAQDTLRSSPHALNLDQFIQIIKAVTMTQQADWFTQFMTGEQHEKVIAFTRNRTFDDQKQLGEALRTLFHDIQQYMESASENAANSVDLQADVKTETAQTLVARWDALMMQFADGDGDFATWMNALYTQFAAVWAATDAPEEVQKWGQNLSKAARFIERVRKGSPA